MKKSFMWILILVILAFWFMRSSSGYGQFLPFYNGNSFTDDDLAS